MKSGPENAVKKKLKELLDRHGIFHWPAAASPYGVAGVSDRLAVLPNGRILAIEVKAPGKKPTPLQAQFGANIQRNNGYWFVVDGDEALAKLAEFIGFALLEAGNDVLQSILDEMGELNAD